MKNSEMKNSEMKNSEMKNSEMKNSEILFKQNPDERTLSCENLHTT
jgi:hypothetical protein